MKTKSLFLCVLLFILLDGHSQYGIFLNTNQSLVGLNPSFAGSNGYIRNQLSVQSFEAANWRNSFGYANSFDAFIKPLKAGVALTTAGAYGSNSYGTYLGNFVRIAYAQYFSLMAGRLKIIPSLELGYGKDQYVSDWYNANSNYFDGRAGLLVNYENKLFAGVSGNKASSNCHLSYNLKASSKIQLQFSGIGIIQGGELWFLLTTVNMISFNHFITGIGLRNFEAPVFNIGYRANYFAVGAGFWFFPNSSYVATSFPLELHASFNLRNKEQRKTLTSFETW